jgi:hypothetical protein
VTACDTTRSRQPSFGEYAHDGRDVKILRPSEATGEARHATLRCVGVRGAVGAALGNAVFDATGAQIGRAPFTPERVKAALSGRAT